MRFFVLLLLASAACHSSDANDAACQQQADAMCNRLDACVENGTSLRYTDHGTCVARQKANCLASLAAPDTGNSAANVQTCAASILTVSCADFVNTSASFCGPPAGKRADGQPCAFSGQCLSAFCALSKSSTCGVCAHTTATGDACDQHVCSRGQECVANACQVPGTIGATCDANHPCGYQLSCVTSTASCVPAGTVVGASCESAHATMPGCDPDSALVCDPMNKICATSIYAGAGQPCGLVGTNIVLCHAASLCFGAQGKTPGTCKAYALEGQACDTDAGPTCMAPARCILSGAAGTAGTCQLATAATCG
jgi:hypothetical protein